MRKPFVLSLALLMSVMLFAGCRATDGAAAGEIHSSAAEKTTAATELTMESEEPTTIDPGETMKVEPILPKEMSMDEIRDRLGFGYELPDESSYPGTITSLLDDSIGENGGIELRYEMDEDSGYIFVSKYLDHSGTDAYDTWGLDLADRGLEVIDGVEVRFRGDPTKQDYRGVAYWKQNGFQYILNCETSREVDCMTVLPLFMETGKEG